MNLDIAGLALKTMCPNNRLIFDDQEMPSAFVYIPKFRLCDVLSWDEKYVHPAFIVGDQEIDGFWFGKFQTHHYNGRAYSLAEQDPSTGVGLDSFVAYNRVKGQGFHEVTAAEWAAVALWCHKNGTEPLGNNGNGKDQSEGVYKAVPTAERLGATTRVATGTGMIAWAHDRTPAGIWDMNGNVNEWCTGLRLYKGELQVLVNNNAADLAANLGASSAEWKAINAAGSWDADIYLRPNGNGTTPYSVKLDFANGEWKWSTSISSISNTTRKCAFKDVKTDDSIGDDAELMLRALALLPDLQLTGTGIDATYSGACLEANNALTEACLTRGGSCDSGADGSVFAASLVLQRQAYEYNIGGRSAYIDLQS